MYIHCLTSSIFNESICCVTRFIFCIHEFHLLKGKFYICIMFYIYCMASFMLCNQFYIFQHVFLFVCLFLFLFSIFFLFQTALHTSSRLFILRGDDVFPLCIKWASLAFLTASWLLRMSSREMRRTSFSNVQVDWEAYFQHLPSRVWTNLKSVSTLFQKTLNTLEIIDVFLRGFQFFFHYTLRFSQFPLYLVQIRQRSP